ncbi:MAG: cytochrome C oxidase subunit IV family protein [Rhodospirillum sp.]|nr:cytochrome C oxidase subunit IV family protein [Rhodospirillum sp.]MCF8488380.1 cytochrome C oxidase subunit IV family protein [Rhodospirillum sp.]MCF8500610.1 cytochrome C oxidase subunit IV family protein [Rhodospirillum sp.]
MRFPQPPLRRLVLSWGLLVALTGASLAAALAGENSGSEVPLAWLPLLILVASTLLKTREILSVFLNLRASTAGWRGLFLVFVGVILAGVLASHGILALLAKNPTGS